MSLHIYTHLEVDLWLLEAKQWTSRIRAVLVYVLHIGRANCYHTTSREAPRCSHTTHQVMHFNLIAKDQRQLWTRRDLFWQTLRKLKWFNFLLSTSDFKFWKLNQYSSTSKREINVKSYLWPMRFSRKINFWGQEDFPFNSIAEIFR